MIVKVRRDGAILPLGASRTARFMMAETREIKRGRRTGVLEAVLDVQGDGVLSSATGPCRKRAVVVLRDPGFPSVVLRDPQTDRAGLLRIHGCKSVQAQRQLVRRRIIAEPSCGRACEKNREP